MAKCWKSMLLFAFLVICVEASKHQTAKKEQKSQSQNGRFSFLSKLKSLHLSGLGNVICPDGVTSCNDGYTCCLLSDGRYGCCPYPNANCCNDHIHCCPYNYYCQVPYCNPRRKFEKKTLTLTKTVSKKPSNYLLHLYGAYNAVICPDKRYTCPGGHTCCKKENGEYACCPFVNAGCCSDGVHCCPKGFYCDYKERKCNKELVRMPLGIKTRAKPIPKLLQAFLGLKKKEISKPNTVNCSGGIYYCKTGETCCLTSKGVYACCPLPNAVCCSDHQHCCQHGTKCDVKQLKCVPKNGGLDQEILKKHPAQMHKHISSKFPVQCPDHTHYCPAGSTCCLTSAASYGCCPVPKAVCCEDEKHCCPENSKCFSGKCAFSNGNVVTALVKMPAKPMTICPDGHTSCPDSWTCCKSEQGYGCCPLPDAVCCDDLKHCCENGYECTAGICNKNGVSKSPFRNIFSQICPDGVTECPSNNTCCKLSTGGYGCCPLPQATCCSDGVHCCPNGYSCSAGYCVKGDERIEASRHTSGIKKALVVCPDGVSQCPSGSTCCKLSTGGYGCCPLPKATCCSDGVHCCPNGYSCSAGSCVKGKEQIEASKHTSSIKKALVVCPDGTECATGSTCCKLSTGGYGCCPLTQATCCSDGVHCCPNGYSCSAGYCVKGDERIEASRHTSGIKKALVVCPDGVSQCPSGSTCCKLSTGGYGCCPLPKATCCSDGVHCCPNGYSCSAGSCVKGKEQIEASKHTSSIKKALVVCPDGTECATGSTCCKLSTGGYGCCPLPQATCCSDGVHCCPNGYSCSAGYCVKGDERIEASRHTSSIKKALVVCPDGVSQCPSGSTCCKLSTGGYGCCPLPKATCCSDGVHCCPNGYSCSAGSCVKGKEQIEASKHTSSIKKALVVCPDGTECATGSTCCKLSTGGYGCCPLTQATCCSDGVHCCPNGYSCSAGYCVKGDERIEASRHTSGIKKALVVCPDGVSQCPSGSTCCKLSTGGYGCCPLPKATCCSDGVHCCPNGYSCSAGSCVKGKEQIEASKHTSSIKKALVVCPDGTECATGSTCCKLSTGGYGCCPLPQATCCSDGVHCCPNGYSCSAGYCVKGDERIEASRHTSSIKKALVVCPDGVSQCPSGSTCCKLSTGGYGCCPLPKATCCSDGVHCCPNGYSCSAGSCVKGKEQIEASKHTSSIKKALVVCPDGTECATGSTCCKLSTGGYGCCPLPQATCCSDGVHCCPNGYSCSAGYCVKGDERIEASRHTSSIKKALVVCPDGVSQCPSGSTCCKLSTGGYGCCPLPKATCCSDGVHCCPNGYSCSAGSCVKGKEQIEASKHTSSIKKALVVCPDGTECATGSTCCKLSTGGYGCCPLPQATCCSDGVHCCPNGYSCSAGYCVKGDERIEASRHTSSIKKALVVCPDGVSQCPSGSTCCKLSTGGYGCCPLPKATCCSDGVHCCPNGYSCSAGSCVKGKEQIEASKHTSSIKKALVVCPDGTECATGSTCCKLSTGGYGCCPLTQATCCSDGVHCCPNGYSCSAGYCVKGDERIEASRHTSGIKKALVVCPDGVSQCPSGSTCCKLSTGGYGCCPLPKATCCSDGVHCCPNGYSCSAGSCVKGKEQIEASKHTSSIKKALVVCPDGTECATGSTCCKLSTGGYGCCPLPQATCCSDGVHCCPNGYSCSAGYCVKGDERIEASRHTSSIKKALVVCPDGVSQCPSGSTCCKLSTGGYGCCPLPKATCCSDGVHCCPNGYSCSAGSCVKGKEQIEASKHTSSIKKALVVCPDGTECATGSTCCKLSTGGYGCCPLPQATCCSDGVHCCPNGYSCSAGYCVKGDERIEASRHTSSIKKALVVCPDGVSQCPSGSTCCKLSTGGYGCCPLPKATCCSDGVHCCPNGYSCSAGSCVKGKEQIEASKHTSSIKKALVVCPDGTECATGSTCCKLSTGGYGCCPLPQATCCSDGVHCCPNGYSCSAGYCVKGDERIEASRHTSSIKKALVVCPDGVSQCPSGSTCCKLSTGGYGCCPLPKATCCSDGVHCCPNGYSCSAGSCVKGKEQIEASKHTSSIKKALVVCPDGTECATGSTCCKLSTGGYGCCPLPQATCCSDGVHCCPNGYSCSAGYCVKGDEKIEASRHTSGIKKALVVCPDGVSQCPSESTCCKLSTGGYGCCPLPKATCCSDGVHCCPNGYSCSAGSCVKGKEQIEASKHTSSIKKALVVCPDGTECATGSTCCKLSTGGYGCCPLPQATCCSDGVHCCPNGYSCSAGYCVKGDERIEASRHTSSIKKALVVCPDGVSQCPSGSTCCKLSTGGYGCCPLPKATCCSDGVHCCPNGYSCSAGSCVKGKEQIEASKHTSSIKKALVVCPDGTECATGSTCCKLSTGGYGCCPLPQATCCSDGVHCCPNGYSCSAGYCVKGDEKIEASRHTSGIKKALVVCPDGVSQCPSESTCCKLSTGGYGCCPLPKATCCSDGVHCCPNGYSCSAGSCVKGKEQIEASKHTSSIKKALVVCPDGTECATGSTCCKLSTGGYGCCPLPQATCCSDGVHCCPNGYSCSAGYCVKGDERIEASRHTSSIKKALVVCPDGVSQCPSGSTCCKLSTGGYGCCPLPKATCCSDGVHCCPNGYSCSAGSCVKGKEQIEASKHTSSIKKALVVCPDGTECATGSTCCKLSTGGYGCCPLPQATCCSDGVHCCPNGYSCSAGYCVKGDERIEASRHTSGIKKALVVCPDGVSQCPSGSTCCKLSTGGYGCCPLPKATCCSDGVHCCPNGYSCSAGSCVKGKEQIEASKHTSSIKKALVVCPDGTECATGSTCCKLSTGGYGCCPLPQATCCSDGVHCCPNGYSCSAGYCVKGDERIEASRHTSGIKKAFVVCPDGVSQCPSGSTCCKLSTGGYGCCPLLKATCCSDGVHCCPNGYSCSGGFCTKGGDVLVASKHFGAISFPSVVVCPDKVSQCSDGSTCCRLSSGAYGCCPLRNAVCCDDHVHCCPGGYRCSGDGYCEAGTQKILASKTLQVDNKKVPALDAFSYHKDNTATHVSRGSYYSRRDDFLMKVLLNQMKKCPNGKTTCKQYETCCGSQCCPYGNDCSKDGVNCQENVKSNKIGDTLCPDGKSKCLAGTSCCLTKGDVYQCCPIAHATCCDDGVHCCPKGWNCLTSKGLCKRPGVLSFVEMRKTETSVSVVEEEVRQDGGYVTF
ncbi:fibrillin-2-like isoform X2 [Hydractinia symbiolongicarpus]|uniref:fibrillin-2-like isoform X2 n=1 Tax=Hydractinia symbiolongicarpus TaxID=13093 RepID=UPI00254E9F05|nr:fibrillin-2-like isoform X2 [Hydractinia symbiolongicarpus]